MKFYKEPWFLVLIAFAVIYLVFIIIRLSKGGVTVTNIDWNKRTFDAVFDYDGQKESITKESWYSSSTDIISTEGKYTFLVVNTKKGSTDTQSDSSYLRVEDDGGKVLYEKKVNWSNRSTGVTYF